MTLDEKILYKDIIEFKNDLLQKMNSLESKFTEKIKNQEEDFSIKLNEIIEKLISYERDVINLKQISSDIEQKNERIEYLEKYKNKTETSLLSHNIRINNIFKEIGEIKSKYDKIFIENLTIPGFVGHSCKFKNLSEYIVHNIKENNKYGNEYNKIKNEIISLKKQTDNLQKMHFGFYDNIVDRTNKLIENNIEDVKNIYEKKFEEILDKINEIKIKNIENRIDIEKYSNEFKLFTEDFYLFKEHMEKFETKIEERLNKIEINEQNNKKIDVNNEKILDVKKSIIKNKKEIEEIKKLSKEKEEKENNFEKMILNKINYFEKLTEEINSLKSIIKQGHNEDSITIMNNLTKLTNELNLLKQSKNGINNLEVKNKNHPINYKLLNNLSLKINNEKRPLTESGVRNTLKKEKEEEKNEKNIIFTDLNNTDSNNIIKANKENILINKESKKEKEIINKFEEIDLKNSQLLFQKSRNFDKNIKKKKNEDIMFLMKYKFKKNKLEKQNKDIKSISIHMNNKLIADSILKEENILINNKEETNIQNNNINVTYIPNIYEEKYPQNKFNLPKNKSKTDFSNLYNLSFNNNKVNKAKIKSEHLSPIVDKMYKEYYIKNNLKESNNNEDNTKKQTIKKLVPAFGRTNYESY